MRKQQAKKYFLVLFALVLIASFTIALISRGFFGQAPSGPYLTSQDGPAVVAVNSPTASRAAQTPAVPGAVASAVAQISGTRTASAGSSNAPTISSQGKMIIVNRATNVQELYAYENGSLVFSTPVTTGSLYLQTFLGTFHVTRKLTNVSLTSPWPPSSPNYYAPEHANYALDYDGYLYIHDATWRSVFGPGTDRPHVDPVYGEMDGSHGCVNTPLSAAQWLYNWAPVGTTVEVID